MDCGGAYECVQAGMYRNYIFSSMSFMSLKLYTSSCFVGTHILEEQWTLALQLCHPHLPFVLYPLPFQTGASLNHPHGRLKKTRNML